MSESAFLAVWPELRGLEFSVVPLRRQGEFGVAPTRPVTDPEREAIDALLIPDWGYGALSTPMRRKDALWVAHHLCGLLEDPLA